MRKKPTDGKSVILRAMISVGSVLLTSCYAGGNLNQTTSTLTASDASLIYTNKAGDTMTGTLKLPANGLEIGANQLVANGGNVGIGTATPRGKLDVSGYILMGGGNQIQITNAPGATGLQLIGGDGALNTIGTMGASEPLAFRTGSAERMRIDSTGNVGIGTTSPGRRLVVQAADGSPNTDGVLIQGENASIKFTNAAPSVQRTVIGFNSSDVSGYFGPAGSSYIYASGNPLVLNTAGQNILMNVSPGGGNVGIGTTAPATTLDVNGTARLVKNAAQPYACDALHDAAIAVTHLYTMCICNGGTTTWVKAADGTTACAW